MMRKKKFFPPISRKGKTSRERRGNELIFRVAVTNFLKIIFFDDAESDVCVALVGVSTFVSCNRFALNPKLRL